MAETKTAIANKPVWVDLASSDPEGSRKFYAQLFGWKIEVNPDPQYGGYAMAEVGGKNAAGIGPKQDPSAPTAWSLYIGSDDVDATAKKVQQAGGKVVAPPFDVGPQGRMAVFQDPVGAFISAWQPKAFASDFPQGQPGTFGWGELNGKGIGKADAFYQEVFGWTPKKTDMAPGMPPYTEFQLRGQSIAGAMDQTGANVPAEIPNFWLVYFTVDDVDKASKKATAAGAKEMMAPADFPGGRFAVLADPQGAVFGLLKTNPRQ
jgi:predicted enzyme related to lactoylglutathione lyase